MSTETIPNNIQISPATQEDTLRVQELRKLGWQDNYVNEESGVTADLLKNKLASLPVPQSDIDYFNNNLSKEENEGRNLVARINGIIVGVIFYETLVNGNGEIGVFIDRDYRGHGIGSALLEALIARTENNLEVTIFAKNRSRGLYKKFGFIEEGEEKKHYFSDDVYLPTQRLVLNRN